MIKIRRATIDDTEQVSLLGRETFIESYGGFFKEKTNLDSYVNVSFSTEKIKNSLAKQENVYWLVYDKIGAKAIGYAKLKLDSPSEFIKDQNTCKLHRIYLLKGYEGQGIGSKLHECIIQTVTEKKYTNLWLSNLKIKKEAVMFYKGKGYDMVGEHNFTIGEETFEFWAMRKKL